MVSVSLESLFFSMKVGHTQVLSHENTVSKEVQCVKMKVFVLSLWFDLI